VPGSADPSPTIPSKGKKGQGATGNSTSKSRSANRRSLSNITVVSVETSVRWLNKIGHAVSEVEEKKKFAANTKAALMVTCSLEVETSAALKQSQTKENRVAYEMAQKDSIRINREVGVANREASAAERKL
ncbi:hypothetical protein MPER_02252, partial [Moniliophthora perniciosa FA553]